ncbi:hypothetical protein ACEPAI_9727 [Sanghuangporus weigelae]
MTLSETIIAAISQSVLCSYPWNKTVNISVAEKMVAETMQAPYALPIFGRNRIRSHERAITLHDALAELLVREDQSGAVAIGSALSAHGLIIFVASDENKELDLIAEHLRKVWTSLQQILRNRDDPPRVSTGEFSERSKRELELRRLVYQYSWNKHMQRYNNYKDPDLPRFFDEVLNQSLHVTDSPSDDGTYIHPSEMEAIRRFGAVCRFMDRCESANALDSVGLDDYILNTVHLVHQVKTIKQDAIIRWMRVLYGISGKFRLHPLPSFIEKICIVERTVQAILHLPYSRHLGAVLDRDINVVPVTIRPVLLQYDLLNDPSLCRIVAQAHWTARMFEDLWKRAVSDGKGVWRLERTVYPHCECALLAHLVTDIPTMKEDTKPYGFIGVSNGSCTGCSLYFSAYNDVAEKAGLPKFYMSKFNADTCHPWAKPEISREELSQDFESRLCTRARSLLDEALDLTKDLIDSGEAVPWRIGKTDGAEDT